MELFTSIILFTAGGWITLLSLWMKTENFQSMFIFKFLQLFLGLACLFAGVKYVGWA